MNSTNRCSPCLCLPVLTLPGLLLPAPGVAQSTWQYTHIMLPFTH